MVIRKQTQQLQLGLAGPQAQLRNLPVGEACSSWPAGTAS